MTAVPAAIDGLLSLARSSSLIGGAGVRIDDGPWLSPPPDAELLVVGWLPIEGPTVAWVEDLAGLDSVSETFDIHNLLRVWRPDTVLKSARDRVDDLLEALRAAVRADQSLRGAVGFSRVVASHMTSSQNSEGCSVSIEFAVQCRVF